jgi:hypothetical protein
VAVIAGELIYADQTWRQSAAYPDPGGCYWRLADHGDHRSVYRPSSAGGGLHPAGCLDQGR